jgi:hypothetical protein
VSGRGRQLFARACLALAVAPALGACKSAQPSKMTAGPSAMQRSEPLVFHYDDVQKGAVDSSALRGRPSVIIFITTYDIVSQAQARFLTMVQRRRRSKIHVAAITLEPADNLPLVAAFRDALHLDYPVALGDREIILGRGPFGDIRAVPTTVVLDENGRICWRNVGLAKDTDIEAALDGL